MESKGSDEAGHRLGLKKQRYTVWLVLIFLLALVLRGPALLGRAWRNAGLVRLTQALTTAPDKAATRAETLLQRAAACAPEDRSIRRWLGFALAAQGREDEAVVAWQSAGEMVDEFLQRGEQAKKAKQYQEALTWYERAIKMESELGDPWYGTGLVYEGMKQWDRAMEAYNRAAVASDFIGIGRSSPHYRQGLIYQWRLEPRQVEAALVAYEAAIEVDDFSSDLEEANCHYQRGEILRWTKGNPDEYIAEYQRAIDLNSDHASAHVYLGVAYYTRDKDVPRAETELRYALKLQPEHQWAWYHLGEIYRQEERVEEAIVMYTQALEIAPNFEIALERLKSLTESR